MKAQCLCPALFWLQTIYFASEDYKENNEITLINEKIT